MTFENWKILDFLVGIFLWRGQLVLTPQSIGQFVPTSARRIAHILDPNHMDNQADGYQSIGILSPLFTKTGTAAFIITQAYALEGTPRNNVRVLRKHIRVSAVEESAFLSRCSLTIYSLLTGVVVMIGAAETLFENVVYRRPGRSVE